MGYCRYQYNASELYQRTKPGTGPETICGARTFPAVDEPEVAVVRVGFGNDGAVFEHRRTGRYVPRPTEDPYCPAHGGSPEPPPPPVTADELEARRQAYLQLVAQYQAQQRLALEAAEQAQAAGLSDAVTSAQLLTGIPDISEEEVRTAAEQYLADAREADAARSEK